MALMRKYKHKVLDKDKWNTEPWKNIYFTDCWIAYFCMKLAVTPVDMQTVDVLYIDLLTVNMIAGRETIFLSSNPVNVLKLILHLDEKLWNVAIFLFESSLKAWKLKNF